MAGCDICRAITDQDRTIVHMNSDIVVFKDTDYRYRITLKKHKTIIGSLLNRRAMGYVGKAIVDTIERMGATQMTTTIQWDTKANQHGQIIVEIMK